MLFVKKVRNFRRIDNPVTPFAGVIARAIDPHERFVKTQIVTDAVLPSRLRLFAVMLECLHNPLVYVRQHQFPLRCAQNGHRNQGRIAVLWF